MLQFIATLALALSPQPGRSDAGFDAVVANFSPQKPFWHEYQAETLKLCSQKENAKCTAELAKKVFLRNVMPCQDPSHPAQDNTVFVPMIPVGGAVCSYSPGHVRLGVHDNGTTITIRTEPDHQLLDGIVIRQLVEASPGEFELRTRGIGNNKSKLWAAANKQMGPIIFRWQNKRVKRYMAGCLSSGCP